MSSFGKRSGGGRRFDSRSLLTTPAVLSTLAESKAVLVREISCTGARLEGDNLPAIDTEFILALGEMRAFAWVKWTQDHTCGVEFDLPFAERDLLKLQQQGQAGWVTRQFLDQKQAYEDWTTGAAR